MIHVDEKLTQKVASLARLELTSEEVTAYTEQLKNILKHIDQLKKVEVQNVAPMTQPLDMDIQLREDEVRPFPVEDNGQPKVIKHAPDVLYDGYKVPPIL